MKRLFIGIFTVSLLALFSGGFVKTDAASLQHATDTITTSKPAVATMHTIDFTTLTAIPAGGKVVISFPGDSNNTASPSATSFAFNGISSSNIQISGITCSTLTIAASVITCTITSGVAAATKITFWIGCSTATAGACSVPAPIIINPTKITAPGTGDRWKIRISTQNSASSEIDTAYVPIATLNVTQVSALVEPTFTFTIGGLAPTSPINFGNTVGCTNVETTSASTLSTHASTNLGILANTPSSAGKTVENITGQLLTVETNTLAGYALTATSSGPLRNTQAGFNIASSTTPTVFPSASNWFGLHPCGADIALSTWVTGNNHNCNTYTSGSGGNICKYGWPDKNPLIIASDATGPIGNSESPGSGMVSVEYAAGIDDSVPGGDYQTVITFIATPNF
ncbi:MAG: hypothetical protein A2776_03120 [Candidatus Levybacteria bacterium RIFCSPHIGHO2_01_FULL_40_10]|nr:MAG: hypothetical protein A2776_03120 [Candidatus Levybacteria bacterium RIFCSPHIGHO2_01_FULL_40_10]